MQANLNELKDALNNGEFFIEYQPIMHINGKMCLGAEALIRWKRNGKVIPPVDFIPTIENTPLSGLFTYWLFETISQEIGEWLRKQENVFVSVNIPPELFGRGGLMYAATKCGILDISEKIVVEITERGVPDNLGLQGLAGGKKHGFKICLDDVGAADENLLLYARTAIDLIKLDKSIADEMLKPDWTPDNIGALEAFTQSTEIQVIAEGIETESQRAKFQELGIQMGQGWLFSHSLSAAELFEFFSEMNSINLQAHY